jgi:hypothetical protein
MEKKIAEVSLEPTDESEQFEHGKDSPHHERIDRALSLKILGSELDKS